MFDVRSVYMTASLNKQQLMNELTMRCWQFRFGNISEKTVYLKTEVYAKCKIQFLIPAFPQPLKQLAKAQSTQNKVKRKKHTSS
jgi:hypothetical protein